MKNHRAVLTLPLAALLFLLTVFPAAAGAELQTVDFDSGPLSSPFNAQGDISFPLNPGFRPYHTDVGVRAHSGTRVGDVGRCAEEVEASGGSPVGCEFFQAHTTGVLSRTAKSVTLFAGRFGPVVPGEIPEQAILTGFNANGVQIATTGPVPIDTSGFDTPLSISRPAGDIASFTVKAVLANGSEIAGDLGIDDVSVNFADGGNPDFSISASNQVLALVQGRSLEVPVQITRLNGSNGPIELSVSGLPEGVSAAPVTVPGSQSAATLTLTAAPTAPDTDFMPTAATITADPRDGNAGPARRTAPLLVRVASNFELSLGPYSDANLPASGRVRVDVPDCAPVDVPFRVTRDVAFDRSVSLRLMGEAREGSAEVLRTPLGLRAEILPSPVVAPGGALAAERTLRLTYDTHRLPLTHDVQLEGKVDGGSRRILPLALVRAEPSASVASAVPGSNRGFTARLAKAGTRVRIHGTGFCPGTTVEVGNFLATAPTTLIDPHTIEFTVPRHATTGRVTIVPAEGRALNYRTTDKLIVDSFRNRDGFPFENFPFDSLSFTEFFEAFGKDDVFVTINPCWPFGSCPVSGGIPDPLATIKWKTIDHFLQRKKISGHCFGLALAAQDRSRRNAYPPFEKMGPAAPEGSLESQLDVEHVKQISDEYVRAWVGRDLSLDRQLSLIEREFARNRKPIVSISVRKPTPDSDLERVIPSAHALLVYDMTQTAETANLYVYDSNKPFDAIEDDAPARHFTRVEGSVIRIDKVAKTWSYDFTEGEEWRGGNKGSLWAIPSDTIPDDPSLPGVTALSGGPLTLLFESQDGTVRVEDESAGADLLPVTDGSSSNDAGTWVSRAGRPLAVEFAGTKQGHYSYSYTAPGFVAATTDVATAKGVRDTVRGEGDSLTVESGRARALEIDLAKRSSAALSTAATIETHASAGGTDSAGFSEDGALTYAHQGAPTRAEFTLTGVRRDGGPATFVSRPIAVGSGDRLLAKPLDRDLSRVRLTVRDARGRKSTQVLRSQGQPRGRLKLAAAKVSGHRLTMRVRLAGMRGRAIVGASLRLLRDGRVIARKALALKRGGDSRRVAWRLPRSLPDGRYRLLADARAVTTGASITDRRVGWVRLNR